MGTDTKELAPQAEAPAPPKRRKKSKVYNTPRHDPAVRQMVAAVKAAGGTNQEAAIKVGLGERTIDKILAEPEERQLIARLRAHLLEVTAILARDSLDRALLNPRADGWLADKVLTQIGALKDEKASDEGPRIVININRDRRTPPVRMGAIDTEIVEKEPACPDSANGSTPPSNLS